MMFVVNKKEDRCTVAVRIDDHDESGLFQNKTAVLDIRVSQYVSWKRGIQYCKEYNKDRMTEMFTSEIYYVDTNFDTTVALLQGGRTRDEVLEDGGDAAKEYNFEGCISAVDKHGDIYILVGFKYVNGEGETSAIPIGELDDVFKTYLEKEVVETPEPKISREDFMEFWRSDAMAEMLTADDRMEIFVSAPVGKDDVTKEALDEILGDYQVTSLMVKEINTTSTLPKGV